MNSMHKEILVTFIAYDIGKIFSEVERNKHLKSKDKR